MARMADHYSASLDAISEVAALRRQLADSGSTFPADRHRLNGQLGTALKLAEVHALLALRAEVAHLAAIVDDSGRTGVRL